MNCCVIDPLKGFLIAFVILAPVALAAGPYDGLYRPDTDWATNWDCTSVGSDGGALAIANDTFFGVESACGLMRPTDVRDMNATLYDLVCSGEGETWSDRVMIMATETGIAMIRDGGEISQLRRCE